MNQTEQLRAIRPLSELNLLDRFLFAEVMDDPDNMLILLQIILNKNIELETLPQTEKEQRVNPLSRFVKLDVWAQDSERTIYDTEVQKKNTHNLPKRSRYYQAVIDSGLLPAGEINFNVLNDVYIIVIAPFDLFGEGRFRYTFRMRCDEKPDIALPDGAVRIFLNTKGRDAGGVSQELIELLHYMEHTDDDTIGTCKSRRIRELHEKIRMIKSNEEVNLKYMQAWEERIMEINEAKEEGLTQGMEQGMERGIALSIRSLMRTLKMTAEQAMEVLQIPAEEREKYARMLETK